MVYGACDPDKETRATAQLAWRIARHHMQWWAALVACAEGVTDKKDNQALKKVRSAAPFLCVHPIRCRSLLGSKALHLPVFQLSQSVRARLDWRSERSPRTRRTRKKMRRSGWCEVCALICFVEGRCSCGCSAAAERGQAADARSEN